MLGNLHVRFGVGAGGQFPGLHHHAGQPSSSEITSIGVPTLSPEGEGHTADSVTRELFTDAAESETLSMCGNSMHGNRDTLETPTPNGGGGRSEKACCRTTDMYVSRESDGPIVPEKRANKAGLMAAAESVEGRGSTKGNRQASLTRCGHSAAESVTSACLPYEKPLRLIVIPEVRAVCGSSARTDLCGGPPERAVPTATVFDLDWREKRH